MDTDASGLRPFPRGNRVGHQNVGGNLGGIVAPALTGYSVSATGSFVLSLAACGVVLVLGVLCYWLLVSERVDMHEREATSR